MLSLERHNTKRAVWTGWCQDSGLLAQRGPRISKHRSHEELIFFLRMVQKYYSLPKSERKGIINKIYL